MMKSKCMALLLTLCLLLAGCQGNDLPDGMDGETLLRAGQDVMLSLVGGNFEAVYDAMRPDVRETVRVEDIQSLVQKQLDGAGVYKQIESRLATGQSSDGETYGVAVLYCNFSQDDVLFRLAFDPDMALIGFEIKKQ